MHDTSARRSGPPSVALAFLACAAAACSGGSRPRAPASAPAGSAAPSAVAAPAPAEATSDRGSRTLPVAPIGQIAPELPPAIE